MLTKFFDGLFPILLVVIFFCGSISVHELGHYLAARIFGLYIPRFSIGFGPRLFSKKIGDTEFCISLLPFGGYVVLPQLADLSEIEGKYKIPDGAKPVTCTVKIIVAAMGAVFNLLFALVLGVVVWYTGFPVDGSMMSRTVGYIEDELVLDDGTCVASPAKQAGLRIGDEIISIDGSPVENFNDIQQLLALGTRRDESGRAYSDIHFLRDGREEHTVVFPVLLSEDAGIDRFRKIGILPKQDLVVRSVYCNANDVQSGDKLVSVDGIPVLNIRLLQEYVVGKKRVDVRFARAGKILDEALDVMSIADVRPYIHLISSDGEFDVIPHYDTEVDKGSITEYTQSRLYLMCMDKTLLKKYDLEDGYELTHVNGISCINLVDVRSCTNIDKKNAYTFLRSDMPVRAEFPCIEAIEIIPAVHKDVLGLSFKNEAVIVHKSPLALVGYSVSTTFKTLAGLFSHHSDVSVRNLMGPVGLVRTLQACSVADFRIFLWFVILINVNLAILNMLPLPVLDGGCVVLALLEKLSNNRCTCVDRVFGALQTIFLFFLLGLLVYVSIFDVKRWRADRETRTEFEQQLEKQNRLRL